jgi:ATP adenylyltransferase
MSACVFCELQRKKSGIFADHGPFFMVFDRHPVSPGHTLVVPKRHVSFIADLNMDEGEYFIGALSHARTQLRVPNLRPIYEAFKEDPISDTSAAYLQQALDHPGLHQPPDGFNYVINEGEAAGQTQNHLHIHVIPRYWGDTPDPVGGGRHVIAGKGNYRKAPPPVTVSLEEADLSLEEDIRTSRDILRKP